MTLFWNIVKYCDEIIPPSMHQNIKLIFERNKFRT